jgi:hypothetical protein
MPWNA